jgi:lysyl-tRNA synthetase, class I
MPVTYDQKLWPYIQAEAILERIGDRKNVIFETGYGPSGLPHIGTFGEVVRTTWVRDALDHITGGNVSSRLIAFSDDKDGLRKIPDNIPNPEILRPHIGKSLSNVPDPYGKFDSFAAHNNSRLMSFLDRFGFNYEFASSTEYYSRGVFDSGLIRMAECHDEIVECVKKTLQKERRATYSPFLPIHPETGIVMQVPMIAVLPQEDMLVWIDPETGSEMQTRITGGACKAQWKADWALRWFVLGIDYEMSGKDLIDSVTLSSEIVKILGGIPPINMTYELFLDGEGKKISKSVGNGIGVDDWLEFAPEESLSYFMFPNPQRAKKISYEVIPKCMDEYIEHHSNLLSEKKDNNPAMFVGSLNGEYPMNYTMLLNLIDVIDADNTDVVWSFINRYFPDVNAETSPHMNLMLDGAFAYFKRFIKPNRNYHIPNRNELYSLVDLLNVLQDMDVNSSIVDIQKEVFEVGKRSGFPSLREWFAFVYSVLLGRKDGPRLGGFIHMYGIENTIRLIQKKIGAA